MTLYVLGFISPWPSVYFNFKTTLGIEFEFFITFACYDNFLEEVTY